MMRFFVYDKNVYLINQNPRPLAPLERKYELYGDINSPMKIQDRIFLFTRKKGTSGYYLEIDQLNNNGQIIGRDFSGSDVVLISTDNGRVVSGYCSKFELEFLSNEFVKSTNERVEFRLSSTLHLEESERRESFKKFSLIFVNNRVIRVEAEEDFNAHELMERLMCHFRPLVTS